MITESVPKLAFSHTKDWTQSEFNQIIHLQRMINQPIESPKRVYMLLGSSSSSFLTEQRPWKLVGGSQHFALPEINLRHFSLSPKLIITSLLSMLKYEYFSILSVLLMNGK